MSADVWKSVLMVVVWMTVHPAIQIVMVDVSIRLLTF